MGVAAQGSAAALAKVNDYFRRWDHDGTLDRLHHALYVKCRELAEREASPTAAIIGRRNACLISLVEIRPRASRARKKGALDRPVRL
jgi:hypothetical protein